MKKRSCFGALAVASLAVWGCTAAAQQVSGPSENRGLKVDLLSAYELGQQGLDDYRARQFRVRQVSLEPGGVVAAHSHKDRPGMAYVVKGTLIEHREGEPPHEYKAGDVISETTSVNHWVENKSNEPVVIIAIDLFKP